MWLNKYKKHDWRYWYDSPKRYAQIEIDKMQSLLIRHIPYRDAYNISLIGKIYCMYCFIYSGHRKKAFYIYKNLPFNRLPKWVFRYFNE